MAGKNVTAVGLFAVLFLISFRFFLSGRHDAAWLLLLGGFVLALYILAKGN